MSARAHPTVTILRSTTAARQPWRVRRLQPTGAVYREFDPFSARVLDDPAAAYRRLHEAGGISYSRRRRLFVIAAFDEVRAAARAHDVLSSGSGVSGIPASLPMMITSDRPRHGELRRMVAPLFTGEAALARRRRAHALAAASIERLIDNPGADAVGELTVPLPVTVISECLGIPAADLADFRRWSEGIIEGFHAGESPAIVWRSVRILRSVRALERYMQHTFERLRADPGDDVLSRLIVSQRDGGLNDEELFWFSLMLLVAGNETTTNLIGSMLLALAGDPGAYQRLRDEPEVRAAAVEEALRWGSPIQGLFRTARRDYAAGGTTVPAGGRVLLAFGAANRDPSVFTDPDRFIVDRQPDEHLGFGSGIHFCLGSHLARMEASAVLDALTERVAQISLAGPVRWTRNPNVRGPAHLPVRLEAA